MEKSIQKICDDVVRQYAQNKNVLGVLLFGSAVRNKFDKYSDIDIYVLLKERGELVRSNFIKNGVRVDIIFNTLGEAKKYLKEDRNNLRRITSHMLAYGKILFQRQRRLEGIRAMAKNNLKLKTKYKNGEILMHKYSIDDFWGEVQRDAKNKDYLAFGIDSHLLITNIVELFLKLNGDFLRQPNEMRRVLKRIDGKFSNQVEHFYEAGDVGSKKKTLSDLIKYVYKKSGGPLPVRWFLKK